MEAAASYLSCIIILVALYLPTIHLCRKLRKRPPSPFLCLPVIGHLYIFKEPIIETFTRLANQYGPIVFLWFGSRPTIVVSSASVAEECLGQNDIVFCNRPRGTLAGKYRGYDDASLTLAPYGPHWKNLRKISAVGMLSSHRLQSFASIRADEIKLLIERLCCSGGVVEMRPQIFETAMNIATRMMFGERYYGEEACTKEAVRLREILIESVALTDESSIGDDVPYLKWLGGSVERKFKLFKEKRDTLMMELFEKHRVRRRESSEMKQTIDANNNNNDDVNDESKAKPLIQSLLELQESNPDYYTDQVVHSVIMDLLIGASKSATNTVEWALSLLLNHPEVLDKVRTEIDNHVSDGRLLNEPDLSHLPYLRCIINETQRMYPPLPFLGAHESSEDCVVGGYHISRGTFLLVNIYAIQNDPKVWDNPTIFRPERFEEGVQGHKIGVRMMPFGSGRRSCPGEGLATRVDGLMLGTIIQCLKFERVDETKLVDMAKSSGTSLEKTEPLSVRIQPRNVMIKHTHKL